MLRVLGEPDRRIHGTVWAAPVQNLAQLIVRHPESRSVALRDLLGGRMPYRLCDFRTFFKSVYAGGGESKRLV
jgi:hypothetical protein